MATPAPILASTLLEAETRRENQRQQFGSWTTGIQRLDEDFTGRIWSSGRVIGMGGLDGPRLPAHLIANHILATTAEESDGRTYVLAPPSTNIVAQVHELLLRATTRSDRRDLGEIPVEDSTLELLESITLLRYLDVAGLAEALSEVSSRLYSETRSRKANDSRSRSLLFVQGLGGTATDTQRRGGLVQAAALLANILRTITHLSRTYPMLLVLVDLDLETVQDGGDGSEAGIRSAFANETGRTIRMAPGGALERVLDGGMDTIVVVHQAEGRVQGTAVVVEVVKDRIGDGFGSWCVVGDG